MEKNQSYIEIVILRCECRAALSVYVLGDNIAFEGLHVCNFG